MPSDLRHAARALVRAPGFTLPAILIAALGTGANTGAFSALDTLLLDRLPYPEPGRLVQLYETGPDGKPRGVAEANLLDWRGRSTAFQAMAVYQPRTFGLTLGERDAVTVVQTGMVMADFFAAAGVPPAFGRVFTEGEEIEGVPLLVLTDRLWRRMFAADPGVVGRRVWLNEEPYTIAGVMPRGFDYPIQGVSPEAFLPLSRKDYCCARLGQQEAVARLKPGVSLDRARAELSSMAAAMAVQYPATNAGRGAGLRPLAETMKGSRREPLWVLMGTASLLLAIAAANLAGLMLSRAVARRHEFAIRAALGAGPARVARQFFLEAILVAVAGAAVGLVAAGAELRLVPRFVPTPVPLALHPAAFLFALGIAVVVTLVSGAAPAILVAGPPRAGQRSPVRNLLVVAQVALSVVLLLGAGLLLRSFLKLVSENPGFDTVHAFKFGIGLPEKRYDTDLKLIAFHRELERRLSELPGVAAAGVAVRLPLRGGSAGPGGSFQIAGSNIPLPRRPRAWINAASPGYFNAMGIPLREGRAFSWQADRPGEHRAAIVNETFVRMYLAGRRTLGTRLEVRSISDLNPEGSLWEVVGVVGDTRQANMDQREPIPEIFLSMTQVGAEGAGYVIRAARDDAALPRAIARTVAETDPRLERARVEPLRLLVERNLGSRDAAIRLVGGFGLLALLLTAAGIYGIVAFRAAGQSREMAIRAALGATAPQLRRMVLGYGLRVAAWGIASGLAAFWFVLPLLRSQLYGIGAVDVPAIVCVALGVIAVALAASLGPSRRAARWTPMELLRDS
jgi:predicted permease